METSTKHASKHPSRGNSPELAQELVEVLKKLLAGSSPGPGASPGAGAPGAGGADLVSQLAGQAAQLFGEPTWKHEVNSLIEAAFQSVVPQLVKRLQKMVDERPARGAETAGVVDPQSVVNSEAMKEMIEEKFRQMLLYLKQDVIPKTLQKLLAQADTRNAPASASPQRS